MEKMDYAPQPGKYAKQQGKKPAPTGKQHHIKKKKVKTATTVMKSFLIGVCVGIIPYAAVMGQQNKYLYGIPFIPVVLYLVFRIMQDLKGWYENDEV